MEKRFRRLLCAAFCAAMLCLFVTAPPVGQEAYPAWDGKPFFENTPDLIDINTAPEAELACLPDIGVKKAQAIVEYRAKNGKFTSIEELSGVKGISPQMVENLRALICIS